MAINKYSEKRPWGGFERFTLNESSTVKLITVLPNQKLSLQFHHERTEFWRVIKGTATVMIGDKTLQAKEGDEFSIPKEVQHRLMAGAEGVTVLEIATGIFSEEDEIRLSDDYNRTSPI